MGLSVGCHNKQQSVCTRDRLVAEAVACNKGPGFKKHPECGANPQNDPCAVM